MPKIEKSEQEWREQLTPEQYEVTREGGTERAFTGPYVDEKARGMYRCVGCGNEIAQEGNSVLPDRRHHPHNVPNSDDPVHETWHDLQAKTEAFLSGITLQTLVEKEMARNPPVNYSI